MMSSDGKRDWCVLGQFSNTRCLWFMSVAAVPKFLGFQECSYEEMTIDHFSFVMSYPLKQWFMSYPVYRKSRFKNHPKENGESYELIKSGFIIFEHLNPNPFFCGG